MEKLTMKFINFVFSPKKHTVNLLMRGIFNYRWAGSLVILLIVVGFAGMAAGDELAEGKSLCAAKCHNCHGANGRGDGPAAAVLNPKPADFTSPSFWQNNAGKKISQTVTKGKGMMPAFNLKEDEI
jgi:mono/diheme cytochrome c family protein